MAVKEMYILGKLTIDGEVAKLYVGGEKQFILLKMVSLIEAAQMKRDEKLPIDGDWKVYLEYWPRNDR